MPDKISFLKGTEQGFSQIALPTGRPGVITDPGKEGLILGTPQGNKILPRQKDLDDLNSQMAESEQNIQKLPTLNYLLTSIKTWNDRFIYLNVKDFGAIGDGALHLLSEKYSTLAECQKDYPFITSLDKTQDFAGLQLAINTGRICGKPVLIPYTKNGYLINDTLQLQNDTDQSPITIIGGIGKGSFFNDKSVTIKRSLDSTNTMLYNKGYGLNLSNIQLDGQNTLGHGWICDRAFEGVFKNIRVKNCSGVGIDWNDLNNTNAQNIHVDCCGIYKPDTGWDYPAFRFEGTQGNSNNNKIDFLHIERSRNTSFEIAYNKDVLDIVEFTTFNHLHIESVIDNTDMDAFVENETMHIGNVRQCCFINPIIYGGKGELIHIEKRIPINNIIPFKTSVIFIGGTGLGYSLNNNITLDTPLTLAHIVSSDYVTFNGFTLGSAGIDSNNNIQGIHLLIDITAGKDVYYTDLFVDDTIGAPKRIKDDRTSKSIINNIM